MFLSANNVFAQEKYTVELATNDNYLILLNVPVAELMANDSQSMKFEILTTLYNEKNQIFLSMLKEGVFRLYILLENNDYIVLTIESRDKGEDSIDLKNSEFIKTIVKLDKVEDLKNEEIQKDKLELDPPPVMRPELREAY